MRLFSDPLSPSEFVIDEECILQLFKSCRECNRQCTVRKQVKGLKLLVYQTCCFCQSCCEWTNLSDDDEGDLQMNGKNAAHEQTNSATSPSSNTSWDGVMSEKSLQVDNDEPRICSLFYLNPVIQWTGQLDSWLLCCLGGVWLFVSGMLWSCHKLLLCVLSYFLMSSHTCTVKACPPKDRLRSLF